MRGHIWPAGVFNTHITPSEELAKAVSGFSFGFIQLFCGFLKPRPAIPKGWIWVRRGRGVLGLIETLGEAAPDSATACLGGPATNLESLPISRPNALLLLSLIMRV
jgi:hypothetical protein